MEDTSIAESIGPLLAATLNEKGYTELTPVQRAVLDPRLSGRDLRISSQTGSGKTVALGLYLREQAQQKVQTSTTGARPKILIVAPTRELAKQVEAELTWLYAPLRVKVASTTGGASYRAERTALLAAPAVVVGTPGRLLDHLSRGAIDASDVGTVVLDEADRMLEMGFRAELEGILGHLPEQHSTHLVSATFPSDVRALADRVQHDAVSVEGTRLGEANADIEHVVHLIDPAQRVDALVNLLLAYPEEQTLVFSRTRADVAKLTRALSEAGFRVDSLSGEMEQPARDRALAALRRGELRALVATDVAARGIDVLAIGRVIHADPPTDANDYVHRSGRTGRAGRKGTSSVLVPLALFRRTSQLLRAAGVSWHVAPVPSAEAIEAAYDERVFAELSADDPEAYSGYGERTWALSKRLLAESDNTTRLVARLLNRIITANPIAARTVREIQPPSETAQARRAAVHSGEWVRFRVSWGKVHGADTRRVLAVACRRGKIDSRDVGTIRIGPTASSIEVRASVAQAFAEAARIPEERTPRVTIEQDRSTRGAEKPATPKSREVQRTSVSGKKRGKDRHGAKTKSSGGKKERVEQRATGGDNPPRKKLAPKRARKG